MKSIERAYQYAEKCVTGKNDAPKYVKKQAQIFIDIADEKSEKYIISEKKAEKVEKILKLLNMPSGMKAGQSLYECSVGYQWLLYISVFCIVYRKNPKQRRYEIAVLEIARKNFKTFTCAVIFILLLLTEPKFSKFYSVAPDGELSKLLKEAISEIVKSSPSVYKYKNTQRFKVLRDYIEFIPKESKYFPLNYKHSSFDGRLPNAFVCDETAALPNNTAPEAMKSGQTTILNKLGFIISTKYKTSKNPFEDEVDYCKRIFDGIIEDDTYFALLYEPDESKDWMTDDSVLRQSNPAALENPAIWEALIKKRERAIEVESTRENFLTKHCNIIYQGVGSESFVDIADVIACRTEKIDWTGKGVYIGCDLSMTEDNCAVSMVGVDDDNNILASVMAFIPEGRVLEKSRAERIDYERFIKAMKCIACGNRTVDYSVIEDFVFKIEETYGVEVMGIGYDRWNALSSAQKWDVKYNTVQVRQHSDTLHPATKLLYEKITNHEFRYEQNELYEINFENARCTRDTNMNRYINKKKSNGKIDMVMATLDAVFLLNNEVFLAGDDDVVQVI